MSLQLLFVCTANVCRSPLMAAAFASAVARSGDALEWHVLSRGVTVARTQPMCALAASLVDRDVPGERFASSHLSTQLEGTELARQDLIIVASRNERARLARMLPSSRFRTFTLKEAVALGQAPLDGTERERLQDARDDREDFLSRYAALLHRRRGVVQVASPPRVALPWRRPDHPQDIPDVHHERSANHVRTLKEMRDLVGVLHDQITELSKVGVQR